MRPRLPRILLNAAAASSAVLCLTTVTLWARCYCWSDRVTRHRAVLFGGGTMARDDQVSFVSDGGRLGCVWRHLGAHGVHLNEYIDPVRAARGLPFWTREASDASPQGWLDETAAGWGPVRWERAHSGGVYASEQSYAVGVSHWVFVGLFAPWPWARLRSYREESRRARLTSRLCSGCGYDLRGTADRCPECGRASFPRTAAAGRSA